MTIARRPDPDAAYVPGVLGSVRTRTACSSRHTGTMWTPFALSARAWRSLTSLVRMVPPGSASATTRASAADPRAARRRSSAARRASRCGTTASTRQVLRNRLMFASRPGRPGHDSTMTMVGTIGGHSSTLRNEWINARARVERSASRLTPPLSRTSNVNRPASSPGHGCAEQRRRLAPAGERWGLRRPSPTRRGRRRWHRAQRDAQVRLVRRSRAGRTRGDRIVTSDAADIQRLVIASGRHVHVVPL